jgi:hypothetical protein
MKRTVCVLAVGLLICGGIAVAQGTDAIQGNWEGKLTKKGGEEASIAAKVVAQGKGGYKMILEIPIEEGKVVEAVMLGTMERDKVEFSGEADLGAEAGGACEVKARIKGDKMTGKISGKSAPGAFELVRTQEKSKTLGAQPPQGAVVLADGKNLDAWKPTEIPWKILDDGSMEVGKGNIVSKQEFGDQKLHVEFWIPLLAEKRGQARGNSGVYVEGRYEIQVLDSFGLPTRDNECGGIYKKATPKTNACLPPTEWQTYDITFHAPKFDDSGKKIGNAVITVEQNGIVIHDNVELDGTTPGGVSGDEAKAGPLLFQDHGNKVRYRNIWVQPL